MADVIEIPVRLVRDRFPDARAAWLGGSAAAGSMTATSDLDVTVLLGDGAMPSRESLLHRGWPVKLFVHTEASLRHFVEQDRLRRRPTLLRLIGSSKVLLDRDGSGQRLRERFDRLDREGPPPLTPGEVDAARYAITDLLDDLANGGEEAQAVAVSLWTQAARFTLGAHGRWWGSGKWLLRELRSLDADLGTTQANDLLDGLAACVRGDVRVLTAAVEAILAGSGGRLFDGYRRVDAEDA